MLFPHLLIFEKLFQEYHQNVKPFGSRSGLIDVWLVVIWVQTLCKPYQYSQTVLHNAVILLLATHFYTPLPT